MNFYMALILFGLAMADPHRSKRFMVFPPTSPTRMQLIAGIGVPVALEYESVTFGYTFKAEYFLADNTTLFMQFWQDPFNPITRPITNRRRRDDGEQKESFDPIEKETNDTKENSTSSDHYEKYDVEAIEIDAGLTDKDVDEDEEDNDDEWDDDDEENKAVGYVGKSKDVSAARWALFKGIEMMADRKGLKGRSCLLKSICEAAQVPFSYNNGILGELMHIVMTPSYTKDTITDHTQNEYLRAEELGRSGEPCNQIFRECPTSVLDQFSGIYSTVENIMKMFG